MTAGFRRLVAAVGITNLADGVFIVALPLVTLTVTRDPAAFTTVTVALRLPWLFFALPAGALADRLDRRHTMVLVNLARGALLGGLAVVVASAGPTLWLLVSVALALGVAETLVDTAAQSIVPSLVHRDELSRANSQIASAMIVMQNFVGPPLGGLLAGLAAAWALGASAAAYALAAVALALIAGSFRAVRDGPPTTLRGDVAEGVRYLFGHPLLRPLALLTGLANLVFAAGIAVMPLFAVGPESALGLSEAAFGLFLTAGAAGSVVGARVAPWLEQRLGRSGVLLLAFVTFPTGWLAAGLTTWVPLIAAGFTVTGAMAITWNVITVSLRQRITPDQLLGRMNAGYRMMAWGAQPLGAFLGGQLASVWGLQTTFLLVTAGGLVGVPLLVARVTGKAIDEAEERSAAAAAAGNGAAAPDDRPGLDAEAATAPGGDGAATAGTAGPRPTWPAGTPAEAPGDEG